MGKANEFLRAKKPKDINRIANRNVGRYLRGNQKPYNEEEQTTQWPKEKNGQTTIYKTIQRKLKIE